MVIASGRPERQCQSSAPRSATVPHFIMLQVLPDPICIQPVAWHARESIRVRLLLTDTCFAAVLRRPPVQGAVAASMEHQQHPLRPVRPLYDDALSLDLLHPELKPAETKSSMSHHTV